MKKIMIMGMVSLLLVSFMASSVVIAEDSTDYKKMIVDLVTKINARWAEQYEIGVQEAWKEGYDSKHCGGLPPKIEYVEVEKCHYDMINLKLNGLMDITSDDVCDMNCDGHVDGSDKLIINQLKHGIATTSCK